MLNEGTRASERGRDVVVGYVETHNRAMTAEAIGGLEIVPRRTIVYRDVTLEEMDVDAILARRPERVLVDELAHTNVPGSRNEKRWQDVEELLAAGIDVTSTLNIQHLESLNDVVERITGIKQRETIPDEIVRAAEQVELVDITPEALRRRMAHGNIYAPDKIDASLANYFRAGNLGALRELALLWVADKVDAGLEEYRQRHGITAPWETRERVVVAITGAPATEALIRRGARIAQRAHGELLGVHVHSDEGLTGPATTLVDAHRKLLEDLGGEFHEVAGADVAAALVEFATAENATQLVLGASHRSRFEELVRGSVINRTVRLSGPIDVHVISHEATPDPVAGARRLEPAPTPDRVARAAAAPARRLVADDRRRAAADGVPRPTARSRSSLSTVLLAFLALVVVVAAVGGTGRPRSLRSRRSSSRTGTSPRRCTTGRSPRRRTSSPCSCSSASPSASVASSTPPPVAPRKRRVPAGTRARLPGWRRRPATMTRCRRCSRACARRSPSTPSPSCVAPTTPGSSRPGPASRCRQPHITRRPSGS